MHREGLKGQSAVTVWEEQRLNSMLAGTNSESRRTASSSIQLSQTPGYHVYVL